MARIDPQRHACTLEKLARGKIVNQIKFPRRDADPARVALKRMLAVSRLKETAGNCRQRIGLN